MKAQNAYTVSRHFRDVKRRAENTDFTTPSEDRALLLLMQWLDESRTLAAFDAWLDGQKEAGAI